MNEMVLNWLLRTLGGGGGLLLLAWLALGRLSTPARRQRLGEWAMAAALLLAVLSLAPAWLIVMLPAREVEESPPAALAPEDSPSKSEAVEEPSLALISIEFVNAPDGAANGPPAENVREPGIPPVRQPEAEREAPAETIEPATPQIHESPPPRLSTLAFAVYATGAVILLGRWLLGHIALWRLRWRSEAVPPAVAKLFAALTTNCHRPRLLLSQRVRVPFSFGLFRATIVLPAAMAATASPRVLRWIFLHEWTHVRRGDAWSSLLFGLGQVLYYPLPWFWRLRRGVRLCQEHLADAAAAGDAPEDYAQFLLAFSTAPAAPAGVLAVSGSPSDLFRRITMLVQTPSLLEPRCPRRWSLVTACALLGCAVLAAGLGFAAPVSANKDDQSKKEETKKPAGKEKEIDKEKPKDNAKAGKRPKRGIDDPNVPPEIAEQIRRHRERVEQLQKDALARVEEMQKELQGRVNRGLMAPPGIGGGPGMGGPWGWRREARLGVQVAQPDATLVEQLDLPKGQGLVVREVVANSAAKKAGLKVHDILLELNGKPVPDSVNELVKMVADIKANTAVEAVVLRKGAKKTIKEIKLPKAAAGFGGPVFAPPGLQPGGGIAGGPPGGAGGVPPGIGGNFNIFAPGGDARTVMTTITRREDRFTIRHQEGSLIITLTGKSADGKAQVKEIQVQDGGQAKKYASVEKVPEQYRDKVKNLIEMSGKDNFRIDIKQ